MIETSLSKTYQKCCINPLLRFNALNRIRPVIFTCLSCFAGLAILPLLVYNLNVYAFVFLLISGFLDTLDGSFARHTNTASAKGAALDIVSDRIVECAIILGLFCVEPSSRALPAILMLGSILICVTSFLIVGIFTENNSEKSFHYSPGLIERAEAFIFFGIMILIPSTFFYLSYLFSSLVLVTAFIRMAQFLKK